MWEILGADITKNIDHSYGRPDSEVGGIKIKKFTGKGQNRKETYGFSVIGASTFSVIENFHQTYFINVGMSYFSSSCRQFKIEHTV